MRLARLQRHWDEFGRRDPYWAILTDPSKKGNRWDLDEFFRTGEHEVADVLAWVASLGVPIRRHRALDFGCGAGRISQALAAYFEQVIGVDIAPSMIALANQHNRHGDRCRFVLNEHSDLRQFPSRSIDFIYSRLVLQHVRPGMIRAYVGEFVRLLDAGGVAVFNVPASWRRARIGRTATQGLVFCIALLLRPIREPPHERANVRGRGAVFLGRDVVDDLLVGGRAVGHRSGYEIVFLRENEQGRGLSENLKDVADIQAVAFLAAGGDAQFALEPLQVHRQSAYVHLRLLSFRACLKAEPYKDGEDNKRAVGANLQVGPRENHVS